MTGLADAVEIDLFADVPGALDDEQFCTLLSRRGLRVERIVSTGQVTPDGEWYDQTDDEWVLLLKGAARLELAKRDEEISLVAGQGIYLPAGCRHRVSWTSPDQPTVWLAVHMDVTTRLDSASTSMS